MKRTVLFMAALLSVVVSPMVRAESVPLTDEHIASIRVSCADAKQGILQVQRTEAVTRVNRGREYEDVLKLLAAFNSRVVLNKLDAPLLTSTTSKMQTKFADFQRHYLAYANRLDDTLEINCKEAPVSFYDNLTAAREARALVASDIREMSRLLDQYQQGLNEMKTILAEREEGLQ